jgi:HAD superfamily hydrolase (TIGR01509 family)
MLLKTIIFGSIGTLVETSELQRQAFNTAFNNAGLEWVWDKDAYRALLAINGGQQRIRTYAEQVGITLSEEQVKTIHADKSAIYQHALTTGGVRLRPGVKALIEVASAEGITLASASTTSADNIQAIKHALGDESPFETFTVVTSAETVKNKKPAPDVFLYVLSTLSLNAAEAIAIEDTESSLASAVEAGIACVVTPGAYVQNQDFSRALAVAREGQIGDLAWLKSLLG